MVSGFCSEFGTEGAWVTNSASLGLWLFVRSGSRVLRGRSAQKGLWARDLWKMWDGRPQSPPSRSDESVDHALPNLLGGV
jgi:hypothetical protein